MQQEFELFLTSCNAEWEKQTNFQIDTCEVPDLTHSSYGSVTGCQVSNVILGVVDACGGHKTENQVHFQPVCVSVCMSPAELGVYFCRDVTY